MLITLPDGDKLDTNSLAEYAVDLEVPHPRRQVIPYALRSKELHKQAERAAIRHRRHEARELARRVKGAY